MARARWMGPDLSRQENTGLAPYLFNIYVIIIDKSKEQWYNSRIGAVDGDILNQVEPQPVKTKKRPVGWRRTRLGTMDARRERNVR